MKNTFLFAETPASHSRIISIMRSSGGHTYHARQLWINAFAKPAGSKYHFLLFG